MDLQEMEASQRRGRMKFKLGSDEANSKFKEEEGRSRFKVGSQNLEEMGVEEGRKRGGGGKVEAIYTCGWRLWGTPGSFPLA